MIPRDIEPEIGQWLGTKKILIIKGARQIGKTTLLQKIKDRLQKEGSQTVFYSADTISQKGLFTTPDRFWNHIQKYDLERPDVYFYCFLDEFQSIPEAGLFLKNLFDRYGDRFQLIVSGSSSLEITKNSEFLTGRALSFEMDRVGFAELFSFRTGKKSPRFRLHEQQLMRDFYEIFHDILDDLFWEYLRFGGYPEIIVTSGETEKKKLIREISRVYLEKDVAFFFKIRNIAGFNTLLKVLADEIGNLLNKNGISNSIGIENQTLNSYLDILEGTYIIRRVSPFYRNIRSETTKMPKLYFLDMGLRNALLSAFDMIPEKIDLGSEAENFVFLALQKSFAKDDLHYHRSIAGSEIDFCIEKNAAEMILAEVKWRQKTGAIRAFSTFGEKYPDRKLTKLAIGKDQLEKRGDTYHIPAVLVPFLEWNA